jgi:hypothetical protein
MSTGRVMKPTYKKFLTISMLVWAGSFIALLTTHIFLMLPQRKTLKLMEKQLTEKKLRYDISRAADDEKAKAMLAQKVTGLAAKLGNFIGEVDDLDSLSFSISKIAGEIDVEAFQSRGADVETYSVIANCYDIGTVSTEVNFNSSFNKFARLINNLERHQPIFFIDEFTINQPRRATSKPEVKLLLTVFVRIPEKDKMDDDSADIASPVVEIM